MARQRNQQLSHFSQLVASVENQDHGDKVKRELNSTVTKDIYAKFHKCMENSKVPLFQDFATYARSLPVRIQDNDPTTCYPLYQFDYLVRPDDLATS